MGATAIGELAPMAWGQPGPAATRPAMGRRRPWAETPPQGAVARTNPTVVGGSSPDPRMISGV